MVDPQQLNQYAYVRNNPLRLIDPTGEDLKCTGDQQSCLDRAREIAGDAADRVSLDPQTHNIEFDEAGLDLSKNEGAKLIYDLANSDNVYGYQEGATVQTAAGKDINVTTVQNLPPFGDQIPSERLPGTMRPNGVDDQVALNPSPDPKKITIKSNTNLKLAQPYTVAFHELAEAYEKLDGGKGGSYAAAHNAAIQREDKLRSQRPNLQGNNPGSGGPANGTADHTIFIKR